MSTKTALIILAQGLEEIEAITPIDLLRRAGIIVTTAGVGSTTITGSHGVAFTADATLEEAVLNTYDAIVLPGGQPGTTNLANTPLVIETIQKAYASQKLCCAICAAPLVLDKAGILSCDYACYPGTEQSIKNGRYTQELVAISNNILTSQAVGTAQAFSLAIIEHLCGADKKEEIATKICYNA